MGDLLAGAAPDRGTPPWAAARALGCGRAISRSAATGPDRAGPPPRGFAIDAVVASARELAGRIAAEAPDLAVEVLDPRASFRAWFRQRSDPRAFFPEPFAAALAPCYAASPTGRDRLRLTPEAILPLDAGSAEPIHGDGPALPPCPIAATWVNDHELGHLADRALGDRRAWFDRFDADEKHRRELIADGFAHALAILRFGRAGEIEARARAGWRAYHLLAEGDSAHFTAYAARPFVALGRSLWAQGLTVETIHPLALARRCREIATEQALTAQELEALRPGPGERPPLSPRLQAIRADAGARAERHLQRTAGRAVTAQAWLAAMAEANPGDAALLHAASATLQLERSTHGLGAALTPAGEAQARAVAAFLDSVQAMLGRALPVAPSDAVAAAAALASRALALANGLLQAAGLSAAEGGATLLLTLQEALALAWEGIEHGLLPGHLDAPLRGHAMRLAAETRVFLARHGLA